MTPHFADRAARALRAREPADLPASAQSRSNSIAALEKALRAKTVARERRRRLAIGGGVLGLAAAIALTFGLVRHFSASAPAVASAPPTTQDEAITVVAHPTGGASVVASSGAAPTTLGDGSHLERGSRVVAGPSGRALLAFSTGTQLTVEESGDLTVVDNGSEQRFRLGSGRVHADVAKLHQGDRFLVETADTEVEVRGTSFDVSVVDPVSSCGDGARTRVSVREGLVVVRHDGKEDRVAAGEEWPRNCAATTMAKPPTAPVRPSSVAPTNVPQASKTSLAAQNDLLEQGMTAKRSGDYAGAATIFDRFLVAYPQSPLVETATVERMRALRKAGDPRARAAARKYLDAYPSGDARPEAEAFLALPQ